MDNNQTLEKLASFSHTEFNTPAIRDSINIDETISGMKDMFGRDGYTWTITGIDTLPQCVQNNLKQYGKWIAK